MTPIPFASLTKRQIFRALLWIAWSRGDYTWTGSLSVLLSKP